MIFHSIKLEEIVQVDDRTRLDGSGSFLSPDEAAITLVEIQPEDAAGFFDVTENLYLDWQYETDGVKEVTLRITTDGAPVTKTKTLNIITALDDRLFSSDADLIAHEDDIIKYLPAHRGSYLDKHRLSQQRIVRYLNEQRIWDYSGNPLTKEALTNIDEVGEWSKFYTLMLIYRSLSNASDDIFQQKASQYEALAKMAQNQSVLRLDRNNDGIEDTKKDMITYNLVRR